MVSTFMANSTDHHADRLQRIVDAGGLERAIAGDRAGGRDDRDQGHQRVGVAQRHAQRDPRQRHRQQEYDLHADPPGERREREHRDGDQGGGEPDRELTATERAAPIDGRALGAEPEAAAAPRNRACRRCRTATIEPDRIGGFRIEWLADAQRLRSAGRRDRGMQQHRSADEGEHSGNPRENAGRRAEPARHECADPRPERVGQRDDRRHVERRIEQEVIDDERANEDAGQEPLPSPRSSRRRSRSRPAARLARGTARRRRRTARPHSRATNRGWPWSRRRRSNARDRPRRR